MITEENLIMWTKPASNTEENKCDSTIANIESCIKNYNFGWLKQPKLKLRGSYKNNTNVKNDSDVDMYVLFEDFCYNCNQNLERIPAINANGPTYKEIKDAVYYCLQQRYGADSIVRGHKSIKVKNNTYRVKADVVPVFTLQYNTMYGMINGVAFYSDNNEFIVNFPEQDSENGCKKNNDTHNLYKYYVRIFKRFRNELENIGLDTNVSSYVIECLLYNVPNNYFMAENYLTGLKNIIYYLLVRIDSSILVEVNQIKQMFRKDLFTEQKTTKENVKTYLWYINNLFLEVVAA